MSTTIMDTTAIGGTGGGVAEGAEVDEEGKEATGTVACYLYKGTWNNETVLAHSGSKLFDCN